MSIKHLCLLAYSLFLLSGQYLSGQQIIDSCFTSPSVSTTFSSTANIANRNADCLSWTGAAWNGDWPGANVNLAPPGNTPGTRAIWMGDGQVWTTGGEGFGLRLNAPLSSGTTYNFEMTRVSHGTGSSGNFAPTLYTNTTGTNGTVVGTIPSAGSSWFTGIVSFTATAANNGHTYIFFLTQSNAAGSGMFLACGNAVVLPMEVRRLEAWAEAESNELAWEMYNEAGYTAHVIERSVDGTAFVDIGELASSGSEETTAYAFSDAAPEARKNGAVLYRIRSLLADGEAAFSQVVEIQRAGASEYLHRVWPNPVTAGQPLQLEFVSKSAHIAELQVQDITGRTVWTENLALEKGMNQTQILVPQLEAGIYLVQVNTATTKVTQKLIVK